MTDCYICCKNAQKYCENIIIIIQYIHDKQLVAAKQQKNIKIMKKEWKEENSDEKI